MSQKQLNRFIVISRVIENQITISEAAEKLGLSERQIKRIKKGVIKEGASFLTHKNTGRQPIHAISDDLKTQIVSLKNSDVYKEANFLHFQEILEEHEGIKVSYTPLYKILTSAGINSPKKRRKSKNHHRRKRKSQEGLLIQIDATPQNGLVLIKSLHFTVALMMLQAKLLDYTFLKMNVYKVILSSCDRCLVITEYLAASMPIDILFFSLKKPVSFL